MALWHRSAEWGTSAISGTATNHRPSAATLSRGFSLYDSFIVVASFALGFAAIGRERFESYWHIGAFVTFGALASVGLCGEAWRLWRAARTTSLARSAVTTYRLTAVRNVALALLLGAGCATLLAGWSDAYPVSYGGNAWQADFDAIWWLAVVVTLGLPRSRCAAETENATVGSTKRTTRLLDVFRLFVNMLAWLAAGLLLAIVLTELMTLHWAAAQSLRAWEVATPRTLDPHTQPASLDFIAHGEVVWWLSALGSIAALVMIAATRRRAQGDAQPRWRWAWRVASLVAVGCLVANVGYALPRFAPAFVGHWDTPPLAWLWAAGVLALFAAIVAGRFEAQAAGRDAALPIPPPQRLAAFHRLLWVALLVAAGAVGQVFAWNEPLSWQTIANACFPETMLQLAVILIVVERLVAVCLRRPRSVVLMPVAPLRLLRTWGAVLLAMVLAIPSLAILGLMCWTVPWYVWRYLPGGYELFR